MAGSGLSLPCRLALEITRCTHYPNRLDLDSPSNSLLMAMQSNGAPRHLSVMAYRGRAQFDPQGWLEELGIRLDAA